MTEMESEREATEAHTAVTARLLHRFVMKIARALTKDVHVRRFTCVWYDAFDYGRYTTLTTSRKVLKACVGIGTHASARRRDERRSTLTLDD